MYAHCWLTSWMEPHAAQLQSAWLDTLPDTPNGAWLRTQLLSDNAALASSWERFFSFHARRDPLDLLAWSRALAATGAYEEALRNCAWRLPQDVRYTFFARAEKLRARIGGSVRSNLRQCKIAVLGSSTTNFLVPVLRALCLRDRIGVEIYEATIRLD